MKLYYILILSAFLNASILPTPSYLEGVEDTLLVINHSRDWSKKKIDLDKKQISYYTIFNKYSAYFKINDLTKKEVTYYLAKLYKMGYENIFIAYFNKNKNIFIPYGSNIDDLLLLKDKLYIKLNLKVQVSKFDQVLDVIPFLDFFKYNSDVFSFQGIPHTSKKLKKKYVHKTKHLTSYMKIYKAIMDHAIITNDNRLLLFKKFFKQGEYINSEFIIHLIDKSTNSVVISGSKINVPNY